MSSTILDDNQKRDLCKLCGFANNQKFKLHYRGSRDGFTKEKFHQLCDNIPCTLTLVRSSNENIFGGYVEQEWDQSDKDKYDPNAFLFSLTNFENRPIKIACKPNHISHYCSLYFGPCFGKG